MINLYSLSNGGCDLSSHLLLLSNHSRANVRLLHHKLLLLHEDLLLELLLIFGRHHLLLRIYELLLLIGAWLLHHKVRIVLHHAWHALHHHLLLEVLGLHVFTRTRHGGGRRDDFHSEVSGLARGLHFTFEGALLRTTGICDWVVDTNWALILPA